MIIYISVLIVLGMFCAVAQAKHNSDHPLSDEDWEEVMQKVDLLEDSGLLPTLLPVIMRNRDALALSDEQLTAFRDWRKENHVNMVNIMNEIIEKMVQFRVESLSPEVGNDHLLSFQSEIQDLQRQLLKIKLSCRELIITTFTKEQWENFAFVVADYPKLASLVSQLNNVTAEHRH